MNNDTYLLPPLAPFFTGIVTARFFETWDFYTTHLAFGTVHESNRELRLVHISGVQLAVLREETDGQPEELVSATRGRGLWLALDVSDAGAEYARLSAAGVEMAWPLERIEGGGRRFAVRDPNGILVIIAQRARAGGEGRAARVSEEAPLAG
ncbi:hypothetical protein CMV30_05765 [Nibricoccus aquaticus]|uniref:VOC domain-containing protein n=1 Tax=Nibricoccus aquaticus TaxID=2576891 RepID=A0A290QGN3_9BACT|nr:VOC family protein [Nibricoccus aquaticus]ATC63501.1 hypothetical protein CMV30_05765 [Nibricoccus aquaticus]